MKYIGKPIYMTKQLYKLLFVYNLGPKQVFEQNGIAIKK